MIGGVRTDDTAARSGGPDRLVPVRAELGRLAELAASGAAHTGWAEHRLGEVLAELAVTGPPPALLELALDVSRPLPRRAAALAELYRRTGDASRTPHIRRQR